MNKKEKLALFLGMLCGDGCLSNSHNGRGQRDYPIQFTNNSLVNMQMFDDLFFDIFGIRGRVSSRKREGRKLIYGFRKYNKEIYNNLTNLGFPMGVKRDKLRIPQIIVNGNRKEKELFIYGFSITDGHFNKHGGLAFHLGSKDFIEDLKKLICSMIDYEREIKNYIQKEKYLSYQLYLNRKEKESILSPSRC
mgnify:CR=1 FL=1|tara:strand:+ start:8167 stop:8742 length:576 start_codon:yes stop_codon:yes gene_type:complete